ncbi:oxygenase MpaB family protein [Amycolatopsis sp. WAC 04197]|uniref:oxygenase MpaB family protein n=1 Tax=Amycolatopsis sp. WAC 04197 TaxID=2203199 RepID=UPI0013155458|nr:oxygenase MpaB family protein [Amycolatopsis sp. WAC 04197]
MTTSRVPVEAALARDTGAAPPGPGSLSWDLVGRWTILAMTLRLIVVQTAHPVVGAGVGGYSDFRSEGVSRFVHTVKSLQRLVYSPLVQSREEARRLRAVHRAIRGTDDRGRQYRGLDPNAYAWVHATLFEAVVTLSELCGEPLTDDEQERFYAEWRALGGLLGLRKRDLPETVAGFRKYFQETVETRLEVNDVVRDLLDPEAIHPLPPPHVPQVVWDLAWPRFRRFAVRLTLPTLPEAYVRVLGVEVSEADRRRMRRFYAVLGAVARSLPAGWHYLPFAAKARRAAGKADLTRPGA